MMVRSPSTNDTFLEKLGGWRVVIAGFIKKFRIQKVRQISLLKINRK